MVCQTVHHLTDIRRLILQSLKLVHCRTVRSCLGIYRDTSDCLCVSCQCVSVCLSRRLFSFKLVSILVEDKTRLLKRKVSRRGIEPGPFAHLPGTPPPHLISSHLIYSLTARVVWAPQMISQPVSSFFPCSPLLSGTWRTPGLSISWCCLPNSSSVCLVFSPLSLCLARWFWPDLMDRRHDNTTAV